MTQWPFEAHDHHSFSLFLPTQTKDKNYALPIRSVQALWLWSISI